MSTICFATVFKRLAIKHKILHRARGIKSYSIIKSRGNHIKTMPCAPVVMVVVLLTMIAFYATSFDSIALTASCYSYHTLEDGEQPNKGIQLMWCILLILLPIALLFAESSMNNLQSVSIVAAFPIGAVIVMIAVSFMKDAKKYLDEKTQ